MKHVFIIHSHTICLSALGVISYHKLSDKDVRFIYLRHYRNNLLNQDYQCIDFSDNNCPLIKNLFIYKDYIKYVDSKINELVDNDNYTLYAPHLNNRLFQIIYTNELCHSMNYVQEGALLFDKILTRSRLPFFYRIFDVFLWFYYNKRIWVSHNSWAIPSKLAKQDVPESYSITEDFFKALPYKRNVIKWPVLCIKGTEYDIEEKWPIFIFESSIEMGVIEKEIYFACTEELIKKYSRAKNYVKFHPYQSSGNKEVIRRLFQEYKKELIVLSDDVPFEYYLSSYSHLTLLGFKSSLLVFGEQMGHKVISMEDKLLQASKKYAKFRKLL